jgi:RNA polymerase sigma factor for flagellar operon FliA
MAADSESALWAAYGESHDRKLRDRLIISYAPIVKFVAGRLGARLPAQVEQGDLIAYGLIGLIDAIERFDPARGVKFETFAALRIRGQMIDELRKLDWVPRAVRARAHAIEQALRDLQRSLGRTPSDEEIAAELGVTTEVLDESFSDIARSGLVALDETWASGEGDREGTSLLDKLADPESTEPAAALHAHDRHETIAAALAGLPDRERLVVTLHYWQALNMREIGEVMGVTESRVSQLHTKAMLRLRAKIGGELD